MVSEGHALARDELIRVLTAYKGTATADGAADGSTLIDSGLIGVNDYVTSKTILIMSGDAINETTMATVFNPATGQITVDPTFNAQIKRGTLFRIINLSVGTSLSIIIGIITANAAMLNAILTLTETGGIVTTTGPGTEDNVYANDAPAGVFRPIVVTIDTSDLAGGETVTVRTYYRIRAGGTARLKGTPVIFAGVQAEPMKDIVLQPNRFGVIVTIEGTAGVVYEWEVHYKD